MLAEADRVGQADAQSSSLLNQAQSMAAAGKWSEAEQLARELLKIQPASADDQS
jgi:hypothetical protein